MYDTITNNAAFNMLKSELTGVFGTNFLHDLDSIIKLYKVYDEGAEFVQEGAKGYVASDTRLKLIKGLVDKEARFMFAKPPSFYVTVGGDKNRVNDLQIFINKVLQKNRFAKKTLQAAKDCFIGRRVALFVDFNAKGIMISYAPSLEFVYDVDEDDNLTKIIRVYTLVDATNRIEQMIYKKKYELNENGFCVITEGLYNGLGVAVKEEEPIVTPFNFIPAYVIINDGLTGDILGESEVEILQAREAMFSKLGNADFDSLFKNMNQVKYTRDMQPTSTANLPMGPGAYWDLSTDPALMETGKSGEVGVLDTDTSYADALDKTVSRLKTSLFEELDMPETNSEKLQGIITSGKAMRAIYWGLMTRCDEKILTWKAAFEWLVETIIEGTRIYDKEFKLIKRYTKSNKIKMPENDYEILVENNYALLDDEGEEKEHDLAEVNAQTMSRKAYMQKWRELTDAEVEEELTQIAKERQFVQDSFFPGSGTAAGNDKQTEEPEEEDDESDDEE